MIEDLLLFKQFRRNRAVKLWLYVGNIIINEYQLDDEEIKNKTKGGRGIALKSQLRQHQTRFAHQSLFISFIHCSRYKL